MIYWILFIWLVGLLPAAFLVRYLAKEDDWFYGWETTEPALIVVCWPVVLPLVLIDVLLYLLGSWVNPKSRR